jgi:hypothetical protein
MARGAAARPHPRPAAATPAREALAQVRAANSSLSFVSIVATCPEALSPVCPQGFVRLEPCARAVPVAAQISDEGPRHMFISRRKLVRLPVKAAGGDTTAGHCPRFKEGPRDGQVRRHLQVFWC